MFGKCFSESLVTLSVIPTDCKKSTCKNLGICHKTIPGFYCDCPPGWNGKTCENVTAEGDEEADRTRIESSDGPLSVIIIGGTNTENQMRVINPTTELSVEIRNSNTYPEPFTYGSAVSMGDGSALICGGKTQSGSMTAECNYMDTVTLAIGIAPALELPEPVHQHQVFVAAGLRRRAYVFVQ